MKSNIYKEQKRRNLYLKNEKTNFIKKGLSILNDDKMFDFINQDASKSLKTNRKGLKVKINNRCVISGRPRSVFQKFKISRVVLREKASYGLITGLSKIS